MKNVKNIGALFPSSVFGGKDCCCADRSFHGFSIAQCPSDDIVLVWRDICGYIDLLDRKTHALEKERKSFCGNPGIAGYTMYDLLRSCGSGGVHRFVINVFVYHPEHVVEEKWDAYGSSVSSFLQETVTYYDYKNVLFRGREAIGWEDYGNGGGDPFEQGIEPGSSYFRDTDINSER